MRDEFFTKSSQITANLPPAQYRLHFNQRLQCLSADLVRYSMNPVCLAPHNEQNDVRGAYNRVEYLPKRKRIMIWWHNQIEAL